MNNLDNLIEEISNNIANKIVAKLQEKSRGEYLTTKEAMSMLKIKSPNTLKKIVDNGDIAPPAIRGERQKIYKRAELENYLTKQNDRRQEKREVKSLHE